MKWLQAVLCVCLAGQGWAEPLRIGSKTFTESHVLAELVALTLEQSGHAVTRELNLGGTMLVWEALRRGEIDMYPEYTGTLSQAILGQPGVTPGTLRAALAAEGIDIVLPLGFNNSYAIAVSGHRARENNITKISQLAGMPELRLGFSLEFLNRDDGWPALSEHYGLPQQVVGLEHALAYRAVAAGELDATDAYTTDGELGQYDLVLLEDDAAFFPRYDAVLIARSGLPRSVRAGLETLRGALDAATMQSLNASANVPGVSPRRVAAEFLGVASDRQSPWAQVAHNTAVHLKLTFTALLLACLIALPLAVWASQRPRAATGLVYAAGLLQTVPSLALLAMLVPLIGLGETPAIIALFLYSLLPIVRNTVTGITSVDPLLRDVAAGMGLTPRERLRYVEIPLAMPTILAGIKTAAIISIGTATLAAFVGAGGLGQPIITGLNLNDPGLILQGAIPAALLAILVEFLFEWLGKQVSPPHLAVSS